MNMTEIAIIAIITLNLLFAIWQTRILGLTIQQEALKLDQNLANAIQVVLEQVPSIDSMEPVNPMQQLIMKMVQDRMKPASLEVTEVIRDPGGKFAKDTSLNTE